MHTPLSPRGPILAAILLLIVSAPLYAGHGHGDDGGGPPPTKPGDHGGGNGSPGGAPSTPPGNSGDAKLKIAPPQGTCDASELSDAVDFTGPEGQSGASHVAHTDFTLVDPTTGEPLDTGATATMMYFWYGSTFDYVLNAHGLAVGSEWTLTYQPEPLPSSGVVCLGSATANGGGQVHLASSLELDSNLPPALDPTADPSTQPPDALLALVPSADVDCDAGANTTFEPDMSLWSNPRVRFVDTDLLAPTP